MSKPKVLQNLCEGVWPSLWVYSMASEEPLKIHDRLDQSDTLPSSFDALARTTIAADAKHNIYESAEPQNGRYS